MRCINRSGARLSGASPAPHQIRRSTTTIAIFTFLASELAVDIRVCLYCHTAKLQCSMYVDVEEFCVLQEFEILKMLGEVQRLLRIASIWRKNLKTLRKACPTGDHEATADPVTSFGTKSWRRSQPGGVTSPLQIFLAVNNISLEILRLTSQIN